MTHTPQIVPGSVKRNSASGGLEFRITCCGELESSVHIQNFARYETDDQRQQVIQGHLQDHAARHANELATEEFIKGLKTGDETECGCR